MDVKLPDGRILRGVPEGTTKAQIMAKIGGIQQTAAPAVDHGAAAMEGMPAWQRGAAGVGKLMTDVGRGTRQLLNIGDQQALQGQVDESRQHDAALMRDPAALTGYIGADVASYFAPGLGLAKVGRGAQLLNKARQAPVLAGAAGGATQAALKPTATGEDATLQAIGGAVGGGVGGGLARGVQSLAKPAAGTLSPSAAAARQYAEGAGYKLTPAMKTGSEKLARAEKQYMKNPGFVEKMDEVIAHNNATFNQNIGRTFGANAGKITDDVIDESYSRIGGDFDRLMGTSPTAAAYKEARSALTKDITKAFRSGDSELGQSLISTLDSLDDFAGRSLPADVNAGFQQARSQYKALLAVDASRKVGDSSVDVGRLATQAKRFYRKGGSPFADDINAVKQLDIKLKPTITSAEGRPAVSVYDAMFGAMALGGSAVHPAVLIGTAPLIYNTGKAGKDALARALYMSKYGEGIVPYKSAQAMAEALRAGGRESAQYEIAK